MLKVYCTECGSPTSYSSVKPKFCSGCGNPLDKTVVNKVLMQKPIADKPQPPRKILPKDQLRSSEESYDDEDDDIEDINYVPEINNLDYEIEETKQNKVKIGDIIGSNKNPTKREKIKGKKETKEDRKRFLENFQKEAGALRPKARGRKNG